MIIKRITQYAPVAYLLLGVYVHEASAQTDYNGSDTLQNVTDYLVNNFDCGDINYLGQGSSAGEQDMCDNKQESTPMSRALNASKVCSSSTCSSVDENNIGAVGGYAVGTDALSLARHSGSFESCMNLAPSPTWQETLRTIYGGKDGQGADNTSSCSHPDRIALANDWDSLFDDCGDDAESGSCTKLRHALRRDDNSGTTGVFMDLIGLDGFCNGSASGMANQDNDPVRVSCDNSERYCPKDSSENSGTLGLVLAITIPSASGKPDGWAEATRNNKPCAPGKFDWRLAFGFNTPCPYDQPRLGTTGLCLFPQDAEDDFGCNNSRFNKPSLASLAWDGREYNERHRYADGRAIPENIKEFHRLALNCNNSSSTTQIGCIVGTHKCYMGFGGVEMLDSNPTTTKAITLLGKGPNLNDSANDGYPLTRSLYFNTLNGFSAAIDPEEIKLIDCYTNPARKADLDEALTASGFFPVSSVNFENTCTSSF